MPATEEAMTPRDCGTASPAARARADFKAALTIDPSSEDAQAGLDVSPFPSQRHLADIDADAEQHKSGHPLIDAQMSANDP
jgi:hypothetical protein